jgi:hypothetical protein
MAGGNACCCILVSLLAEPCRLAGELGGVPMLKAGIPACAIEKWSERK